MKVKGLPSKIFKLSPNGGFCNGSELGRLKEGNTVDLKKEQAEQLLSMGMVELIKESKVKEKNNGN
tara:strand:- start:841 stop:1038 length:198 start_codon:yes stop_codon:yes gene_type:complete